MTRPPRSPSQDGAPEAHGVAGWPHGEPEPELRRPDTLPDGSAWPTILVLVTPGEDMADSIASVTRQDYAESGHVVVDATMLKVAIVSARAEFVLVLRAGDLLAPGALAALGLEASLRRVDAVAGLRVLFADRVLGLDIPSLSGIAADERANFTGGEILFSRSAVATLTGAGPADWWAQLAASGGDLLRIGRPVLLQRSSPDAASRGTSLSVASLTGTGYGGGAGIAQRRLAEALALLGHRVEHLTLTEESLSLAAEWTDAFPLTEARIREGGFDWVLAGNLHGATRSLDILGRIVRDVPVAAVLHDLFPLTGRCAHPKGCTLVETGCNAACPTPDESPQLSSRRIAGVHARKRAVLAGPQGPRLLANSGWTARQARAFAPPATAVSRIALAIPCGVFRPLDRSTLRRTLGLPAEDVLVLFSAVIVDAPDKGFSELLDALRRVARPGVGFVAIGRLDDPARLGLPNLYAPGPIAEEAGLAAWYGACDLHITASRFETLGQTPIEAGLCGTPTLAYGATGLTTSVIDGVSGRLVPLRDGALAAALEDLIADGPARRRLGAFGRIALENRFSHAAAAISLHEVLCVEGLLPVTKRRLRFLSEMLGRFAFAAERTTGSNGTVPGSSHPLVRRLRQAKQAMFGRNTPLWLRWALYAASRAARRSVP